ncbi:hypothetical protein [Streptomyces sp. NBC_00091]|uniref:hypothetical protein n=1 Tax=Streptomyces sp. NBC_00091 TaxID=2975648 RepID=UPI002255EB62|nr:hypothetical protein [Streptomyces sp. NBC_00091]MCX5380422.1 hypothetical protein [Streptomyces sp. NBC_00091]
MVNARTYLLWRDLAMSVDLPKEALKTVIEALCTPARSPHGFDRRDEQWREEALRAAMPALLARTTAKRLRARILLHADQTMLASLAAAGTVTTADLPGILRTYRPWAGLIIGLARHPHQVDEAIALLPRLACAEMEQVIRGWDPDRHTRREGAAAAPPVPQALFDAVLEASLTPLAAFLLHPQREEGWEEMSSYFKDWSLELGSHVGWAMLARCPERWVELVADPTLGAAVQHLLLDRAETQALEDARDRAATSSYLGDEEPPTDEDPAPALSDELLLACLPALCLPELSELPNPTVTARRTLHHIADRVRDNPRLAELATDQLHAAADALVRRGRLLSRPEKQADDYESDGRVLRFAQDLALLGANPDHLAGACVQLASLDQPAVVSPAPSRVVIRVVGDDTDRDRPAALLERHSEHRRVQALAALAANPHTPHAAVSDVLTGLHPAELAWIAEKADGPDWFLHAAAAVPAEDEEDDGVLRLLTDDDLDKHPDPAAVLQSWLDSPAVDEILSRSEVYRTVIKSRHRTLDHLLQLPADEVLSLNEPEISLQILLDRCGRSSERWAALAAAMTFEYNEEKITFGALLDSLDDTPARPAPRAGRSTPAVDHSTAG